MHVYSYLLHMILKLKEGESLEYLCKISGLTPKEVEMENGFMPKSGQYFYLPRENEYIIKESDTLFTLQKKTKLPIEEIIRRVKIEIGKKLYY